jgi:hypothetical protein
MFKVGDEVFVFDRNNRVYDEDKRTIYRKFYVPRVIVGETKISWLLGYDETDTRPERHKKSSGSIFTARMVDDMDWMHDKRYRISEQVKSCFDVVKLKQIKELLEE